jgi:hypothetical protein
VSRRCNNGLHRTCLAQQQRDQVSLLLPSHGGLGKGMKNKGNRRDYQKGYDDYYMKGGGYDKGKRQQEDYQKGYDDYYMKGGGYDKGKQQQEMKGKGKQQQGDNTDFHSIREAVDEANRRGDGKGGEHFKGKYSDDDEGYDDYMKGKGNRRPQEYGNYQDYQKGKCKGQCSNIDYDNYIVRNKMEEKQVSITRKAMESWQQGRITHDQLSEMLLVAKHLDFEAGSPEELQFVKDYEMDKGKGKGKGDIYKGKNL